MKFGNFEVSVGRSYHARVVNGQKSAKPEFYRHCIAPDGLKVFAKRLTFIQNFTRLFKSPCKIVAEGFHFVCNVVSEDLLAA